MQPELTIAIPAHNEEKFIGKAIESALRSGQLANRAVEVVVALNRCTDQTQHIAESLGAKCVVEDQRIIAAVRNAGVISVSVQKLPPSDKGYPSVQQAAQGGRWAPPLPSSHLQGQV